MPAPTNPQSHLSSHSLPPSYFFPPPRENSKVQSKAGVFLIPPQIRLQAGQSSWELHRHVALEAKLIQPLSPMHS